MRYFYKKTVFTAALSALLILSGCGGGVEIQDETLRLSLGQEQTLSLSAGSDDELTFSSMDPNIASVDENGTVRGLGNGITVISVRGKNDFDDVAVVVGSGVAEYVDEYGNTVSSLVTTAKADASLVSGESDITSLSVSIVGGGSDDVTISTDRTYELKIVKTPIDSADKVTLRVADGSVARVEGKTLIGVGRGKTTLTASAPNGVSAEMIVRVK